MTGFHARFNLPMNTDLAWNRLMVRLTNDIFVGFINDTYGRAGVHRLYRDVATQLGVEYFSGWMPEQQARGQRMETLRTVEAVYSAVSPIEDENDDSIWSGRKDIDRRVQQILALSEVDLGLRWENGRFYPSGAELLDEQLVNDPLRWMQRPEHDRIREPFEKGLTHYLQAGSRPELLQDAITDMYEALEAAVKYVTGRDADLSANRELFIKRVKASEPYKRLLKEYIEYANLFRHAEDRPRISAAEAESFMYLTGLFIRLALPRPSSDS